MSIVLLRVDERLIHGQVVVGWGLPLQADRIVVVDDGIAESSWEQELYCLGVPPEMEASFSSVEEARREMGAWRGDENRRIVLVRDLATLERLAADGRVGDIEANLGGIHHAPGRDRVLPYLFLGDEERASLERLMGAGVRIAACDLPGSRSVPAPELIGE
jgi:mannose/fructose/N-acetylgalactosamine-specific phosphotransferase system component IIB